MPRILTTTAVMLVASVAAAVLLWLMLMGVDRESDEPASSPMSPAREAPPRPTDAIALTVERVVDGDTLRAHAQESGSLLTHMDSVPVRLIGIDTPEISGDVECWGTEATEELRALAPAGSTVWATADVEIHDRYDRWLFYLWTEDGRFINRELVASGAANVLDIAPNSVHADLFVTAEAGAQRAGLGLWGSC